MPRSSTMSGMNIIFARKARAPSHLSKWPALLEGLPLRLCSFAAAAVVAKGSSPSKSRKERGGEGKSEDGSKDNVRGA
eukprot:scaffold273532_cov39-Tisochrysis_lutea.AAC.4